MREELQKQMNNRAHAYVIFGDKHVAGQEVRDFLQQDIGVDLENNPDVFTFNTKSFSISQAREVSKVVSRKTVSDQERFVVIVADSITVEAQNALLKTIEDPNSKTSFFIIIPTGGYILDTIISRTQILTADSDRLGSVAAQFFSSEFVDRLEIIDSFNDDEGKVNKGELVLFFSELEKLVLKEKEKIKDVSGVYQDFIDIKQYVLDRSSSVKQITEFISLRLPVLK